MSELFTVDLLRMTLRMATPVLMAALGCLMTDQVGIMNIGIDGMMLLGAFAAVMGSYLFQSFWMGLLFAVAVGVLLGLFYYVFSIRFHSDEFIIGVALNIFASGLTVFLLSTLFGNKSSFNSPLIDPLPTLSWGFLDRIPILGPMLNNNTLLVYISMLMVLVCWLFLYKTPTGFWLRASGEHPESLRSAGKSPEKMKRLASILCGVFSGLAGAHLALGYLTMFSSNMTASRGYVAVACVIFGASNPPKVMIAALLFGFLDALGLALQSVYPDVKAISSLTSTIPYVMTVVMMVAVALINRAKKKSAHTLG